MNVNAARKTVKYRVLINDYARSSIVEVNAMHIAIPVDRSATRAHSVFNSITNYFPSHMPRRTRVPRPGVYASAVIFYKTKIIDLIVYYL
jgi:hypothetical protein